MEGILSQTSVNEAGKRQKERRIERKEGAGEVSIYTRTHIHIHTYRPRYLSGFSS